MTMMRLALPTSERRENIRLSSSRKKGKDQPFGSNWLSNANNFLCSYANDIIFDSGKERRTNENGKSVE